MVISEKERYSQLWVVTVQESKNCLLPEKPDLIKFFEKNCKSYVFQLEQGERTKNYHYQCALRLKARKRKQTLMNDIERFGFKTHQWQLEPMFGTYEESVEYCTKSETAIEPPVSNLPLYKGADISFLEKQSGMYPWQSCLYSELYIQDIQRFKDPDDRKIVWITDRYGNSGKSKFTKFMVLRHSGCTKIAFGSATQLRSSVISAGPMQLYIIDVPRTMSKDDDMNTIISVLEDIKNGFVCSSMYGKNSQLLMQPPHVVVFSNMGCPRSTMSSDRWDARTITKDKTFEGDLNVRT